MHTNLNYAIEKNYLTTDWSDLYQTSQVIATAVKEFTVDLKRFSKNDPDPQLYIHHIDRLSRYGYGFEPASDSIYYTPAGNFYKCEALIELIDNLKPHITILSDNDIMLGDSPIPAVKIKCALANSNRSHLMLLICEKAMKVLNTYKNNEESRKNNVEESRKNNIEGSREREKLLGEKNTCCVLL